MPRTTPVRPTTRVTERIVDRVVKAEIDPRIIERLREELKGDMAEMLKTIKPGEVDLSAIQRRLDEQAAMIAKLIECCEMYKKDRAFDLRKTAHFEEQLCDILTLVKQQQECLDKLCKQAGVGGGMGAGMASGAGATRTVVPGQPVEFRSSRFSVGRDIDSDMFNGRRFIVNAGVDIAGLGGNNALQVYGDHFEKGTPLTGFGLAGRFYTGNSGSARAYAGLGVGSYQTNFNKRNEGPWKLGGKLFVGLETNRRTYVEFNVTRTEQRGSKERTAVLFGQRF